MFLIDWHILRKLMMALLHLTTVEMIMSACHTRTWQDKQHNNIAAVPGQTHLYDFRGDTVVCDQPSISHACRSHQNGTKTNALEPWT